MVPSRRQTRAPWVRLKPTQKLVRLQRCFPDDHAAVVTLMDWVWRQRLDAIRQR